MNHLEQTKHIKNQDLKFGQKNEDDMLPILNIFFKCNLQKTKKFDLFDFIDTDKKIIIELKSRNVSRYTYPTTMIGQNKVDKADYYINLDYTIYFVFKFTDGLFYFKADEDSIEKKWSSKGGREDRGRIEYKDYVWIPSNLLKKIF